MSAGLDERGAGGGETEGPSLGCACGALEAGRLLSSSGKWEQGSGINVGCEQGKGGRMGDISVFGATLVVHIIISLLHCSGGEAYIQHSHNGLWLQVLVLVLVVGECITWC